VKARATDMHTAVSVSHTVVSETETDTCNTSDSARTVPDNSGQSTSNSNSLAAENRHADDHRDVIKKLRLQKHTTDSWLASPIEGGRLQTVATLGAGCLGNKPAKVTYVGSGVMKLPSPVLSPVLASVSGTSVLSYSLYTPFVESGQSLGSTQLIDVSSLPHAASHLPTDSSSSLQTLIAADRDPCKVDSSAVDTEVVQTAAGESSLSSARKQHTPVKKKEHGISPGRYLSKHRWSIM